MIRYELEAVLAAPPDEAFAEVLDVGSWRQWVPGVLESGCRTAGEPRVGHRAYVVRQLYGLRVDFELELTELDRPWRLTISFGSRHGLTGRAAFAVEPADGATRIRLAVDASSSRPTWLHRVAGWVWRRADERALRRLRERLGG